ncbi:dihydrodipicolinate synthase family protein [Cellulosimicrobium funkei]|nr:dihydrodipicolinate synthase family protein [Cellulosimicrobium funkei]
MSNENLAPGLWGILATPFSGARLDIDKASLAREVQFFRDLPATGVVALGVFGEGAALSHEEQKQVVRTVTESAPELPVVVGLSARSTAPALEQSAVAIEASSRQLAGLMVQINSASPSVLAGHLQQIHDATGLGIVLQDYPLVSGVRMTSTDILETLVSCPFVVAIKSEAPPTAAAIAELTHGTQVPVFGGLGGVGLIDELAAGAAGAMTGFSRPEGLLAAIRAWDDGGMPAAYEAFSPWLPLANFEAQPGIGLALRKELLRQRGIFTESGVRRPSPEVPPQLMPIMQQHLNQLEGASRS